MAQNEKSSKAPTLDQQIKEFNKDAGKNEDAITDAIFSRTTHERFGEFVKLTEV